jgi:hypothetical protein
MVVVVGCKVVGATGAEGEGGGKVNLLIGETLMDVLLGKGGLVVRAPAMFIAIAPDEHLVRTNEVAMARHCRSALRHGGRKRRRGRPFLNSRYEFAQRRQLRML